MSHPIPTETRYEWTIVPEQFIAGAHKAGAAFLLRHQVDAFNYITVEQGDHLSATERDILLYFLGGGLYVHNIVARYVESHKNDEGPEIVDAAHDVPELLLARLPHIEFRPMRGETGGTDFAAYLAQPAEVDAKPLAASLIRHALPGSPALVRQLLEGANAGADLFPNGSPHRVFARGGVNVRFFLQVYPGEGDEILLRRFLRDLNRSASYNVDYFLDMIRYLGMDQVSFQEAFNSPYFTFLFEIFLALAAEEHTHVCLEGIRAYPAICHAVGMHDQDMIALREHYRRRYGDK